METLYKRADNGKICYCKTFLFFPKKIESNWHWLSKVWVRATYVGFDPFKGSEWLFEFLSDDSMMLEKLSNDLVVREIV